MAATGPQPSPSMSLAERHDFRQKITGAVCFPVHYRSSSMARDDISSLRNVGGRTFVEDLDRSGLAYKAGVRAGDEVVRVKVGSAAPVAPRGDPEFLARLGRDEERSGQPMVVLFMGFAGKFPAEVRVAGEDEERQKCISMRDLTSDVNFELSDVVSFNRPAASLMIASRPLESRQARSQGSASGAEARGRRRVAKSSGDVDQSPDSIMDDNLGRSPGKSSVDSEQDEEDSDSSLVRERSDTFPVSARSNCSRSSGAPWRLIELEHREAKKLLAQALISMTADESGLSHQRVPRNSQTVYF